MYVLGDTDWIIKAYYLCINAILLSVNQTREIFAFFFTIYILEYDMLRTSDVFILLTL